MSELQGRVLKNYNGYYYVSVEDKIYTCKVKGKMKQNRFSLATGDMVSFQMGEKDEGMIKKVLPRKNFLLRPTIANLDLLVVTFACASPDFSYILADKLFALAELAKIPPILVLNKKDLAPDGLIEEVKATQELNIHTEPEYFMTEADVINMLQNGSVDAGGSGWCDCRNLGA